jgi:formyltetrahydrofolate deformylase
MAYRKTKPKVASFSFAGEDKKGIISTITSFFFYNNCNILDIDQRILDNYLIMNTLVDFSDIDEPVEAFLSKLKKVTHQKLKMKLKVQLLGLKEPKKIALLVSKEDHCADQIIKDIKAGKIKGQVKLMLGNHDQLAGLAKKHKIPFHHFPSVKKKLHEEQILKHLDKEDIDLVVLARYMQILSPDFNFRYEGRIINIHPSLLPAFPGPRGYHQAFNKGVDFVGVTAHFVTTDLDEGPIICQDAFKVNKIKHKVEDYIKRGQVLEAKTLAKAVKLFCDNQLSLRRGKVIVGKDAHELSEAAKRFYS